MKRTTEYWLRPLDEYGDAEDILFFDHFTEALMALREMKVERGDFPYDIERVVRLYADDGELKDEQYTLIRYCDSDGIQMELFKGRWRARVH